MRFREVPITATGIIPARLASTRLAEKLLLKLNGKTILQHVYENAKSSKYLEQVVVACDSDKIVDICKNIGADYLLTPPELPSGTDRIAYCADKLNIETDVIINIQADEPLITGNMIDYLFERFAITLCDVGTFVKKINSYEDLINPNVVKVVRAVDGNAMYFSRYPIPYYRDIEEQNKIKKQDYWKHIGIYAYRIEALRKFTSLPQTDLEVAEKLEQLRLLQNNVKYACIEVDYNLQGVDTSEDFEKLIKIFEQV